LRQTGEPGLGYINAVLLAPPLAASGETPPTRLELNARELLAGRDLETDGPRIPLRLGAGEVWAIEVRARQ